MHVDRLADDSDRDEPASGRAESVIDRTRYLPREAADRDDPDPVPPQVVADQRRIDLIGEGVGLAEFGAQFLGVVARVLEVPGQALLEVLAGVVDRVAAEGGPDDDADREGEEDRDQRGRVVARAVAHMRRKARCPAKS